jgi:hypothetical protein
MGEIRNAYNTLGGKPEGKRLLGRPRRRWEYNIKMIKVKKVTVNFPLCLLSTTP